LIKYFSDFRYVDQLQRLRFAIKVESCQKSRRIFDVFSLPNFGGTAAAAPPPFRLGHPALCGSRPL